MKSLLIKKYVITKNIRAFKSPCVQKGEQNKAKKIIIAIIFINKKVKLKVVKIELG